MSTSITSYLKPLLFLFFLNLTFHLTYGKANLQTERIIFKLKEKSIPKEKSYNNTLATGCSHVDEIYLKYHVNKIENPIYGLDNEPSFQVAHFPKGTDIHSVISELLVLDEVEYAEPDAIAYGGGATEIKPNDAYYSRQWSLKNNGTFPLAPSKANADIEMEKAWQITQGDSSIIVGIIDTGLKLNHPEFSGRIWKNYKEIAGNGIDDDKNGYIDDVKGWDFVNSDNDPTDDYGHGTNVTGILGATGNNTIGYAGMDWKCKLMALKGLDSTNSGYYSMWISAIYYAVNQGARVLNMSLGGSTNSTALQNAVNYALNKNVVVVACMMNYNSAATYYAAGFPGVIAVGSTNPNDQRSNPFFWSATSGSNYGKHISVVAPGNYIYGLNHLSNTNYNYYWGGTSQATPHVAGLASLLLSANPNLSPAQIKSIIERTAVDQVGNPLEDTPGWDQYYGFGRINAHKALLTTSLQPDLVSHNEKLIVYPSRIKGHFTVMLPDHSKEIIIINGAGQIVDKLKVTEKSPQEFELNDHGVYLIHVRSANKNYIKKLIIK